MRTWIPAQKPADNALWRYAGLPANRGMRLIEFLNQGLPVSARQHPRVDVHVESGHFACHGYQRT
jgi:hypothetical protein